MTILETQFAQRAFDGKWQKLIKTLDYENAYSFTNDVGNKTSFIPEKWIVTNVYDYMMEMELKDGTKY